MTDDDLLPILNRLHRNARELQQDLHDSAWPAASGTNAGLGARRGGPRSPCNDTILDEIRVMFDQLSGPAMEIWENNPGQCWPTPRHEDSAEPNELASWVSWLRHPRHRPLVLALDWADDFLDILRTLDQSLDRMVHPAETSAARVSDWPTVAELAGAAGCTEAAMHKRLQRAGIRPFTVIAGENVYQREDISQIF